MQTNNKHVNELRSNFRDVRKAIPASNQQAKVLDEITEMEIESSLPKTENEAVAASNQQMKIMDELAEMGEEFFLPNSEIEAVKNYINSRYDCVRTNKLTKRMELTIMGHTEDIEDRTLNGWLSHLWSYETYLSVDGRSGKEVEKKVTIDKNKLYTLINNEDFSPTYDPIDEYFKNVAPLAEGITATPEIDKFIKCFSCDNEPEVVEKYFKAWLAGVFTNYYSDDDKFDGILILQSNQGAGKTFAIEHRLLKPFEKYVVKNFQWNTSNKDEMIKLATSLFIFDDELSAMKKSEVEDLKKITSLKLINNVRPPYGIASVNYVRRASFIGATNNTSITNDATGTRRFLILDVKKIDWEKSSSINYDLLWSEAYNYFHFQGNKIKIDPNIIEENNKKFKFVSAEEQYLDRLFDFSKGGNTFLNATQILDLLKQEIPTFNTDVYKIGKALRSKGFVPKSRRIDGAVVNCYHLYRKTRNQHLKVTKSGDDNATTDIDFDELFFGKKGVANKTKAKNNI